MGAKLKGIVPTSFLGEKNPLVKSVAVPLRGHADRTSLMVIDKIRRSQLVHVPWDLKRRERISFMFFSCEKRTYINIRKAVIFFTFAEKYIFMIPSSEKIS